MIVNVYIERQKIGVDNRMDTIEIKDDDINTEDIMRQIRENIRKRKESGIYTGEIERLINEPLEHSCNVINSTHYDLQKDINYINSNWNMRNEYNISSHRSILGRFLVWGRRLVHGEVRRYVDPIIGKQTEFNTHIVRILNSYVNKKTDNAVNYFLFEEKFRGDNDTIKKRQSIFIEYFKNSSNVLDIGCGRGEFLSLLKDNNIGAKGIDVNADMVSYCQKNGLDVQKVDALSYLESLNNESLDGIFSAQVIEHIQSEQLINIIKLCHDKVRYGSYFVIETINPLCLSTFSTFFADLSHIRPIHPHTIRFLLESVGFRDVQCKLLSPFPEASRLNKMEIDSSMRDKEKVCIETMNQNIEKLNSLLYGYQDYAIIAKK